MASDEYELKSWHALDKEGNRLDENYYPPDYEILDTRENREILAEKVLSLYELSQIEKEFIHKHILLPEDMRGKQNKYDRNLKLAIEEEKLKKNGMKSKEIMKILVEQFNLYNKQSKPVDERTYLAALKMGKEILKSDREDDREYGKYLEKRRENKAYRLRKQ